MKLLRVFTTLALSVLHVSALVTPRAAGPSYDGIKVLRVVPSSKAAVARLQSTLSELSLETWSDVVVVNDSVDVLVPQAKVASFEAQFPTFEVIHEDLGQDIRVEREGFADENCTCILCLLPSRLAT